MPMEEEELASLLESLLNYGQECEWIEFKKNNDSEIGEYISALSNSATLHDKDESYLVFGVDDSTKEIVGTKVNFKDSDEIQIRSKLDPRTDFSANELYINGKRVLLFIIESAKQYPTKYCGEAFIRIKSSKTKLSKHADKEKILWQKLSQQKFESTLAYKCKDESELFSLLDCSKFFKLLKIPSPDSKEDAIKKLIEYKVIAKKYNKIHITNLGAILFAIDLRKFDNLQRKAVRIIIYNGINKVAPSRFDETWYEGYAIIFESLIKFIELNLPINEVLSDTLRTDKKLYPIIAVREFMANALIHQDFSITGTSPMVEIYDNRMEITNPGSPLIAVDRFIDHAPESRNEKLAFMMRQIGICEERGSGVDRAIDACEIWQLPAPDIQNEDDYTRVTLFAPKPLNQMETKEKIRAVYQHCVLKYVAEDSMTNESIRKRFGIDDKNYPAASRIIKAAVEAGVIMPSNPELKANRYQKYVPYWVQI